MKVEIIKKLRQKGIEFIIDEPMSKHTTFKIGGPVDLMILPLDEDELIWTVREVRKLDIPFMILGNGSNLLVRDSGIRGAVIKLRDNFDDVKVEKDKIVCKSGALLSTVSKIALKNSLAGFEFASGIPGSLGGAITMNAGAYGGEMKDVVSRVRVLDERGQVVELDASELELGYRTSIIKTRGLVVLEVEIQLKEGNYEEIDGLMKDLTERRTSKQPLEWASGGSTFKRPEGYFAGKLIDDSGLRGLRFQDAQVSEKHCGFIINRGSADFAQVMELVKVVQKTVKDKFDVDLEMEIMVIGDE